LASQIQASAQEIEQVTHQFCASTPLIGPSGTTPAIALPVPSARVSVIIPLSFPAGYGAGLARDLARCLTHYWRRAISAALMAVNFPEELGGRSLSRILLLPGNRQVFDAGLL
jgi:hypothetical protein